MADCTDWNEMKAPVLLVTLGWYEWVLSARKTWELQLFRFVFFFFYTDFKYNICFNACFFSHRVHSEIARNILDEAQACLPPPIQFLIVKLKRLSGSQAYCL